MRCQIGVVKTLVANNQIESYSKLEPFFQRRKESKSI
jgi:hypothetical protein